MLYPIRKQSWKQQFELLYRKSFGSVGFSRTFVEILFKYERLRSLPLVEREGLIVQQQVILIPSRANLSCSYTKEGQFSHSSIGMFQITVLSSWYNLIYKHERDTNDKGSFQFVACLFADEVSKVVVVETLWSICKWCCTSYTEKNHASASSFGSSSNKGAS